RSVNSRSARKIGVNSRAVPSAWANSEIRCSNRSYSNSARWSASRTAFSAASRSARVFLTVDSDAFRLAAACSALMRATTCARLTPNKSRLSKDPTRSVYLTNGWFDPASNDGFVAKAMVQVRPATDSVREVVKRDSYDEPGSFEV